jgi:ribosomal protein S18 acetylase RimI-like enzyme
MNTEVFVSTDQSLLDRDWIIAAIQSSYWGGRFTEDQLLRAIETTLCFGIYTRTGCQQLGFARVLTDGITLSSVTDLIVREEHRRSGLGTMLMRSVLAHPRVSPTICVLQSRNAVGFYQRLGFCSVTNVLTHDPA